MKKSVFMVMPFNNSIADANYNHSTKKICETEFQLKVIRADEIFSTNLIVDDIINAIEKATIIIADITGDNPNVFYELGIAHTLKKKQTIVITQDDFSELPFDVAPFRIIQYNDSILGKTNYEEKLSNTLSVLLSDYKSVFHNEFELVKTIFLNTGKASELYYIPALSKFNGNVIADQLITVEGKNAILNSSGTARSINSIKALKVFLELEYCEIFGDKVIVSEKGKAFADYLNDEGFVPVSINEKEI